MHQYACLLAGINLISRVPGYGVPCLFSATLMDVLNKNLKYVM